MLTLLVLLGILLALFAASFPLTTAIVVAVVVVVVVVPGNAPAVVVVADVNEPFSLLAFASFVKPIAPIDCRLAMFCNGNAAAIFPVIDESPRLNTFGLLCSLSVNGLRNCLN